jgi:hypothetical protein
MTDLQRTFHVPTQEPFTLNVREAGHEVHISIGPDTCALSKEQFEMLCQLRYEIDWTYNIPVQSSLPIDL